MDAALGGVQMIRAAAVLQLPLGNVDRPGGGVNALRSHSNIRSHRHRGNLRIPARYLAHHAASCGPATYLKEVTPRTLNDKAVGEHEHWSNYPKFVVSFLKSLYGAKATKENDFGYGWLPKTDGNYSWLYIFDEMYRGGSTRQGAKEPGPEGLITAGMNPVGIGPNTAKMIGALAKLKWLVVVENYESRLPPSEGAPGIRRPMTSEIQTEVYQLPATGFAEKAALHQLGALDSVERKALEPPGQRRPTRDLRLGFPAVRTSPQEGGAPPSRSNVAWDYTHPEARIWPGPHELNRRRWRTHIPRSHQVVRTPGQQLDNFGQLKDDGTTACANWLYTGVTPGRQQRRPPRHQRPGPANFHRGALLARQSAHHVQPPSADARAPVDPKRPGTSGTARCGRATSRTRPDSPPGKFGASTCSPRAGRLYAPVLNDGPFTLRGHQAPTNPLHPKVTSTRQQAVQHRQDKHGTAAGSRWSAAPTAHRDVPLLDPAQPAAHPAQPGFVRSPPSWRAAGHRQR
jgi:formate dehydrogenase major subunit